MDIYKGMHEQSRIEREQFILKGLDTSETLHDFSQLDKARVIDLTMQTDDPENTVFVVIFIPFVDELYEILHNDPLANEAGFEKAVGKIQWRLNDYFDSQRDHAEEIHVSYMNNEWVITYNANR